MAKTKKASPADASSARPWPASSVAMRAVEDLVPYARNARQHSAEQVAQLARSIETFGWTIPVLVAEDGTLIAGHGRLLAAAQLGIAEVPTMVARGWTDEMRRAYTLADNRLAENATWDDALLAEELRDLGLAWDPVGLLGFSEKDLERLIRFGGNAGLGDPEEVPEVEAQAVSLPGDIWILGDHRIACGSSTDPETVTAVLAGEVPHLMVTDPPYGVEYDPKWRAKAGINKNKSKMGEVLNDDRADWREAWALFPGDVAYVWHAGLFAGVVHSSLEAVGFQVRSQIIWAKDRFALSRGDYHWHHEPGWYAVRKGRKAHWNSDRSQHTLWTINARDDSGVGHGTQKPIECMKRPIDHNSAPGDGVYEPFAGSGTTIIAGEITGRRVFAIELNPLYVDVAVRRWQTFTGRGAVLESSGAPFDAVAKDRAAQASAAVP
ncbi:MAG: site-specific DNA-methyltransferase [Vicinamibacteria bacterium]|nr:site-specific DNA-methyltransferase [Vicinamibacteria bacterium]